MGAILTNVEPSREPDEPSRDVFTECLQNKQLCDFTKTLTCSLFWAYWVLEKAKTGMHESSHGKSYVKDLSRIFSPAVNRSAFLFQDSCFTPTCQWWLSTDSIWPTGLQIWLHSSYFFKEGIAGGSVSTDGQSAEPVTARPLVQARKWWVRENDAACSCRKESMSCRFRNVNKNLSSIAKIH